MSILVWKCPANDKQRAFAHDSLLPALEIPTLELRSDDNSAKRPFATLIARSCLLPYTEHALQYDGDIKDVATDLAFGLSAQVRPDDIVNLGMADVTDADQLDADRSNPSLLISEHHASGISFLFEILMSTVAEKRVKRDSKPFVWLQEVFKALAGCVHLDINEPKNSIRTARGVKCLDDMLKICRSFEFSLDPTVLGTIIIQFSGLDEDTPSPSDWALVKACIEIDYKVVTGHASTGNQAVRLSVIIKRITANIIRTDLDMFSTAVERGEAEAAMQNLFKPLLSAFARARKLPRFLTFWEQKMVTSFTDELRREEVKTREFIWERGQQAVISSLESSSGEGEKLELLDKSVKRFQFLIGSEPPTLCALAIVLSCLLRSLPASELHKKRSEPIQMVFEIAARRVLDTSIPVSWKHSLWRLLDCCIGALEGELRDEKLSIIQDQLIHNALDTVQEAMSSERDEGFYIAAEVAWQFLSGAIFLVPLDTLRDIFSPVFYQASKLVDGLRTDILQGDLIAWDCCVGVEEKVSISSPRKFLNVWFHNIKRDHTLL